MRIKTCITLIILGAVLVAAGLGVREVRYQLSPATIRASLERDFERFAEGQLSMEVTRLEMPGRLRIEGLAVTAPEQETPMLECERVLGEFDTGALLRGKTEVRGLRVNRPVLRLSHDAERDRWDFLDLLKELPDIEPDPPEPPRPPREALVDGVQIEDATVELRYRKLFRDDRPRTIEGLYLTARPDHSDLSRWRFSGHIQRGPLRGIQLSGYFAAEQDYPVHIEIDAGNLMVDRGFWDYVPHGDEVWELFRPVGRVAARGTLRFPHQGPVHYSFDVTAQDLETTTEYVPAPVTSVRGGVTVSEKGIVVHNLTGLIPAASLDEELADHPPLHVRVNSSYSWRDGRQDHLVEADDIPLARATLEAIPEVGGELWERLRPDGTCRLTLRLREPGRGQGMQAHVTAELRDVILRPGELPRPVEDVTARLEIGTDQLSLTGLRGTLLQPAPGGGPPARAEVRGNARIPFNNDEMADINLHVTNLRSDAALVRAVPTYGERVWDLAQPEVTLEGRLSLVRETDGEWHPTVQMELLGGRAQMDFWPVPLRELRGRLRIDGTRMALQGLRARLETGVRETPPRRSGDHVLVDGWVDLTNSAAQIELTAQNLRLSRELVTSLPEVGPAIWEQSRPRGMCTVTGSLLHRPDRTDPLMYLLRVDLHDVAAEPATLPVPLSGLAGQVLITDRRAVATNLTGVVTGGTFDGAAVAYYGAADEYPTYAGTFRFRQLDLQEILERASDRDHDVRGLLSGIVDVGGVLDGVTGISAAGNINLTEGRLWRTPFFARLIHVLHLTLPAARRGVQHGEASFTHIGNRTEIHEFEVIGGGLDVSGYGTIGRNQELDMRLLALGARDDGTGIPIVSSVAAWVMRSVGGVLFRVDVSGTLEEPRFTSTPIRTLITPLTTLRGLLYTPVFGPPEEGRR